MSSVIRRIWFCNFCNKARIPLTAALGRVVFFHRHLQSFSPFNEKRYTKKLRDFPFPCVQKTCSRWQNGELGWAMKTNTQQPIDPRVVIGHVHLKVADLERALAFYCGVLGFELTQRYG